MKRGFDSDFRLFATEAANELSLDVDADPAVFEGVYLMRLNELIEIRFIPEIQGDLPTEGRDVPEACRLPVVSANDARLFSLRSSEISITTHKDVSSGVHRIPLYAGVLPGCDEPIFGLAWVVDHKDWLNIMREIESLANSTSYNEPSRISVLTGTHVARLLLNTVLPSPMLPDKVREIVGIS